MYVHMQNCDSIFQNKPTSNYYMTHNNHTPKSAVQSDGSAQSALKIDGAEVSTIIASKSDLPATSQPFVPTNASRDVGSTDQNVSSLDETEIDVLDSSNYEKETITIMSFGFSGVVKEEVSIADFVRDRR